MDEDERRIGLNEALFREVNERVRTINEGFSQVLQDAEFVCECGDHDCDETLVITAADFTTAHSAPNLFVVKPGHVYPEVERVVGEHETFAVVEKQPAALSQAG